jgi:cell division protein FtsB
MTHGKTPIGPLIFFACALLLAAIFTLAAVQGSYGIFRRAQIEAEVANLEVERTKLKAELLKMSNLTHRLSDDFLDVDLLDERAREVLGTVRSNEIVIR